MKPFCAVFLLSLALPLIPSGKNDPESASPVSSPVKAEWAITAPETAIQGECITVIFSAENPLENASVILRDSSGEIKKKAASFDAAADIPGRVLFTRIALIALSTNLESGTYLIEATAILDGETIRSISPLSVEKRNFISEEIQLDASNTALKTDISAERIAQIEKLNKILFSQNLDAPRFFGPFIEPLSSKRRTSQFGDRRAYRYSNKKTETSIHYGIDFGVPTGTPVFASGDGRIVFADKRISTGWTVMIEHLPGVFSLYYHLDALLTSVGETVRAGSLIARTGSTGLSTGPHLHWEFRINGEAVSPDFFVGRTLFQK